jgi:hypothetical protein
MAIRMAERVRLIRGILTPLTLRAAFGRPILSKGKIVELRSHLALQLFLHSGI